MNTKIVLPPIIYFNYNRRTYTQTSNLKHDLWIQRTLKCAKFEKTNLIKFDRKIIFSVPYWSEKINN